jgi:hypothetical protein
MSQFVCFDINIKTGLEVDYPQRGNDSRSIPTEGKNFVSSKILSQN